MTTYLDALNAYERCKHIVGIYPADSDYEDDFLRVQSHWDDLGGCWDRDDSPSDAHMFRKLRDEDGAVIGALCRDCDSVVWGPQIPSRLTTDDRLELGRERA